MQNCKWCYYLQDDWNRLANDFVNWFGEDKVAFLKVDGDYVPSLAKRYSVRYYP